MTDTEKRILYPAHNRLKRQLDKTYCEQGSASYNEEAEQILSEFNNMRVEIQHLQAQLVKRDKRITELGKMYKQKSKHVGNLLRKKATINKVGE